MSKRKNPYTGDARTRAAKQQGYPARSVFKLDEIDKRVRLLEPGQRVLDLGAAPGSWSLYASGRVGPRGKVVAVDLNELGQRFAPNVVMLTGDARELGAALGEHGPFDVVLSDMAPSTTGNKLLDQSRSFELFMTALELARALGGPGSHFVAKLFMSAEFGELKRAISARYAECRVVRPEATRSQSSEVFLVGLGLESAEAPAAP